MTDRVPAEDIERIVGAQRLADHHVVNRVTNEQRIYILHSVECVRTWPDLRGCPYSLSLDDYGLWDVEEDEEGYLWLDDTPIVVDLDSNGFIRPIPHLTFSIIRPPERA